MGLQGPEKRVVIIYKIEDNVEITGFEHTL